MVLIHCNIVNNSYQQNSRVLYAFVPNISFGNFLDISPENVIFPKAFDSKFSYVGVWFTDQNSNPLEIDYKINVTLVINQSITYKKMTRYSVQRIENICKRLWIFIS